MSARAERRRAERAAHKEADRTARWLSGIPEPTLAAARQLAAELLGQGTAEPETAGRVRLTLDLLGFAEDVGMPVEDAAEMLRGLRERELVTITTEGGLEISEEQSARIEALAEEQAEHGEEPGEADVPPPLAPVQLTRKGTKALADMVVTIAHESGHSVEHVALGLSRLHESGKVTIDRDGKVTFAPGSPGPGRGDRDDEAFAETVRARIVSGGSASGSRS